MRARSHLRSFGKQATARIPPGAPVLSHNGAGEVVALLGRRDVEEVDVHDAATRLAARPRRWYVALRAEIRPLLGAELGRSLEVVHEERQPDGRPPPLPRTTSCCATPGRPDRAPSPAGASGTAMAGKGS